MSSLKKSLADAGWWECLGPFLESDQYSAILEKLRNYAKTNPINPTPRDIFNPFIYCRYGQVKCVIVVDEPYSTSNTSNGLALGSQTGNLTPELSVVIREVESSHGIDVPTSDLSMIGWAKQGVLLLNKHLTVGVNSPRSHQEFGWGGLTERIVSDVNSRGGVVFMLWGAEAGLLQKLIDRRSNGCLTAGPPGFRGGRLFSGCGHFVEANRLLTKQYNKEPVDWSALGKNYELGGNYDDPGSFYSIITKG